MTPIPAIATFVFLGTVGLLGGLGLYHLRTSPTVMASPAADVPGATKPRPRTQEEFEGHATRSDCWLLIRGRVYDVTTYIDQHPAPPEAIIKYCGKEATGPFESKELGRPHSSDAFADLERLYVGDLLPERKPDGGPLSKP